MKKALVAALVFVLVGFMMVNGTLAGTFEAARDIFADLTKTLGETFGKPVTGDSKFDVDLVNVGEVGQLYPGGSATQAVAVMNNSTAKAACFRVVFAVQKTDAWNQLTIGFTHNAKFEETIVDPTNDTDGWHAITIGGDAYMMKVFTYTEKLDASKQSDSVAINIYMDEEVTTAQINQFRADFLKTQVLAIDADAFLVGKNGNPAPYASPVEALNAALPMITEDKVFNPFQ